MDRFYFTHPTPAPEPVAPAQPVAYGPPTAYPGGAPEWATWPAYAPAQPVTTRTRTRGRTPHGLHAVLTLCTLGLWSPMWVGHALWNHATIKRTTVTRTVR
jgi:hypothetical protein